MVRFLIRNGADVDEIAQDPLSQYRCFGSPLRWALNGLNLSEFDRKHIRLLLDAGADPYSSVYDEVDDLNVRFNMTLDGRGLALVLNNPIPFFDFETRDIEGRTMLLSLASNYSRLHDPVATISTLLAKGVDISARDRHGRNCLQLVLESSSGVGFIDKTRECVVLLIRSGADIHNVDEYGVSIPDYAYRIPPREKDSCLGDKWDAALSECGYDIRQMRHGYHRLPEDLVPDAGNWSYKRQNLKQLWKGREDACPYYHDPPIWCPQSTSPDGSCPFGGEGLLCPGPEATSSCHPGTPNIRAEDVPESETDDLYGGDDIVLNSCADDDATDDAGFSHAENSGESDESLWSEDIEADGSDRHVELLPGATPIREIVEEESDVESASDSSSEYYDTYDDT
ncbi:uncharacterized protein PV07_01262 [Cladophialophora immunda]|uniref:Uncharacterized protein n=1 Tax=Cladophialophora immunda TaxID=569365 RepID=A0A0D2A2F1_9EURO|nr:uncharacterized protein PV07_01262 [Cladophialophora immunda]KIW34486.1 hypothetical protein PV07_01262 [Cladophialophora immunda]